MQQVKHVFFEDELEAQKQTQEHTCDCRKDKYRPEEKEEIVADLIVSLRPIDKHHPSAVLEEFHCCEVLSEFLATPEFAYFIEYLRVWNEGKRLIYNDDKDEFGSFLKSNRDIIEKLPPIAFMKSICSYSSIGCANVLLESGLNVDMNSERITIEDWYKFHYTLGDAVNEASISVEMIKLLLKHGADPDALQTSPLFYVLADLTNNYCSDWTPTKSIYKLFYLLSLPELEESFEMIKLLVSHTKLIDRVVIDLIERRKFEELTALLIAARDRLLVSSGKDGGLDNTLVGKYILAELRKELEELKILTDVETLDPSKHERKSNFVFVLNLVSSLSKCIDVLDAYRVSPRAKNVPKDEVPFDIAAEIVCNTDLNVQPQDVDCNDIKRLRPKVHLSAEVLATRLSTGKGLYFNYWMSTRHHKGVSWLPSNSFRSFHASRASITTSKSL